MGKFLFGFTLKWELIKYTYVNLVKIIYLLANEFI